MEDRAGHRVNVGLIEAFALSGSIRQAGRTTMNRRRILALASAAFAWLVVALPTINAIAQPAAELEGVKAASKAFYAALAVIEMARQWIRCGLIRLTSQPCTHVAHRSLSVGTPE
jgi:hypothetical protein